MFSYVDFGFMLDFIVFIMRSVFSGVRGIRDVRADINSPLFCLTDRERDCLPTPWSHNSYHSARWASDTINIIC